MQVGLLEENASKGGALSAGPAITPANVGLSSTYHAPSPAPQFLMLTQQAVCQIHRHHSDLRSQFKAPAALRQAPQGTLHQISQDGHITGEDLQQQLANSFMMC